MKLLISSSAALVFLPGLIIQVVSNSRMVKAAEVESTPVFGARTPATFQEDAAHAGERLGIAFMGEGAIDQWHDAPYQVAVTADTARRQAKWVRRRS